MYDGPSKCLIIMFVTTLYFIKDPVKVCIWPLEILNACLHATEHLLCFLRRQVPGMTLFEVAKEEPEWLADDLIIVQVKSWKPLFCKALQVRSYCQNT